MYISQSVWCLAACCCSHCGYPYHFFRDTGILLLLLPLNVILCGFYGFLKHSTTFYVAAIYLLFPRLLHSCPLTHPNSLCLFLPLRELSYHVLCTFYVAVLLLVFSCYTETIVVYILDGRCYKYLKLFHPKNIICNEMGYSIVWIMHDIKCVLSTLVDSFSRCALAAVLRQAIIQSRVQFAARDRNSNSGCDRDSTIETRARQLIALTFCQTISWKGIFHHFFFFFAHFGQGLGSKRHRAQWDC